MRLKILFISSWYPNRLEPTNGNFVQRHAASVQLLHDVEVLHAIGDRNLANTYLHEDEIKDGVRTVTVYYRNSANPLINFIRRMNAYRMGFSKITKPDLVHANILHNSMLFAVYLKKRFNIPYVISEHWSGFLKENRSRLSKSRQFISKFIAQHSSRVIPVSHYLEQDLKSFKWSSKYSVVGNVVDTALFSVQHTKNDVFTFLHISNLIPLKNPDAIIRAALRLRQYSPHFQLHIGGDGDVMRLEKIINEANAGSFIKTFSMLSLQEVAQRMKNSHCFILFSKYENFPCVLLESLSAGVPAIATNVGGIPEIIKEGMGILINESEEELYAAMLSVLNGQVKFQEPSKLHGFIDDEFSMSKIAEKFSRIYYEVLQQ